MNLESANHSANNLVDRWLSETATSTEQQTLVAALRAGASCQDLATQAVTEALLSTTGLSSTSRRLMITRLILSKPSKKLPSNRSLLLIVSTSAAALAASIVAQFLFSGKVPEANAPLGDKAPIAVENSLNRLPMLGNLASKRPPADIEYFSALSGYYLPEFYAWDVPFEQAVNKLTDLIQSSADCPKPKVSVEDHASLEPRRIHLNLRCFSVRTMAHLIGMQAGYDVDETERGFYFKTPTSDSTSENMIVKNFGPSLAEEFIQRQTKDYSPEKLNVSELKNRLLEAIGTSFELQNQGSEIAAKASKRDIAQLEILKRDLTGPHGNWVMMCTLQKVPDSEKNPQPQPGTVDGVNRIERCKLGVWAVMQSAPKRTEFEDGAYKNAQVSQRYRKLIESGLGPEHPRVIAERLQMAALNQQILEYKSRFCLQPATDGKTVTVLFKETASSAVENLGTIAAGQAISINFPSVPGYWLNCTVSKPQQPRHDTDDLPFGIPVEGRLGFVRSPYANEEGKMVDVADVPPGTKVICPYTGKPFRAP